MFYSCVFLTELSSPYSLNARRGWHTSESELSSLIVVFLNPKTVQLKTSIVSKVLLGSEGMHRIWESFSLQEFSVFHALKQKL